MNDQKRRREGAPSVKKVNFRRNSNCVLTAEADHAKGNENQKTSGLKVKRSRRSKRRSSLSSCSESEAGGDGKNRESSKHGKQPNEKLCEKSLTGVVVSERKTYCSTPVRRGNDIPDCVAHVSASIQVEQAFERQNSPFGAGIRSIVENSSFFGDDSALADLNLSEIITSSAASVPAQRDNCTSSMKEESSQFYCLPLQVKELIQKYKGIESLYEWQTDCLNLSAIKERRNLIYSLPTSGGKTLVAEILIFKELLLQEKDVLFILPFVSIVQEKVKSLTQFAVELGFLVEEYAASRGQIPPRNRRKKKSVYIATIEKANALVNSLIGENRISTLGLVVVDELHMLGEAGRGATLEMCLAKLMFVSSTTQIIGMSATLSNIADLKTFLKAEVYSNDFRPVELKEFVKVGHDIYKVPKPTDPEEESGRVVRRINNKPGQNKELLMRDPDQLLALVLEVIPQHSCLVFCSTKKNCQTLALLLVNFMPRELCQVKAMERHQLMKALYNEACGLCPVLKQTIPFGIAYHHSGLTMDERKLIEDGYSQGVLCLLTCTSTLAAGVNLPAKRVIIRAPYVGRSVLSKSQYKQMIGRAGRAGIDTSGESILIIKDADKPKIQHLFSGPLESCCSSLLIDNGKGLRAMLLTLIGLKLCTTSEELRQFMQNTLLAVQSKSQSVDIIEQMEASLDSLQKLGHVNISGPTESRKIEVTHLGRATFKGCIDVDSSPMIYSELARAQENLVLANELHLLYLVTPLDLRDSIEPEWMTYYRQVSALRDSEQKVAELLGATEGFLSMRATGQRSKKDSSVEATVRRFYLTLILYKLLKENTVWDVAGVFNVTRGFVQNLLTSASSFASCMVHFTGELHEFWGVNLLLEAMVKKLSYTASLELVPLMEARARQLLKAGYKSLSSLAWADANSLVTQIEHLSRRQAHQIVSAAKMLLEEKADALREEAEEMTTAPELHTAEQTEK
ncbi:hypothetical protein ACROYT_G024201 [Oculina patagonica]